MRSTTTTTQGGPRKKNKLISIRGIIYSGSMIIFLPTADFALICLIAAKMVAKKQPLRKDDFCRNLFLYQVILLGSFAPLLDGNSTATHPQIHRRPVAFWVLAGFLLGFTYLASSGVASSGGSKWCPVVYPISGKYLPKN